MVWPDVLVALLAGPLLVAGAAKATAPAVALYWPVHRGLLAAPRGPKLVAAAELVTALLMICVPGRQAAVLAAVAFGTLAVVAWVLRERGCACFGVARLAEVGRGHIAVNVLAAIVAAAAVVGAPGDQASLRSVVAVASAVTTAGTVLMLSRRARGKENAAVLLVSERTEPVHGVRLYTSEDCPSCGALKALLSTMDQSRRDAVAETRLGAGETAPGALAGLGVPCAQGTNRAGEFVGEPVIGIGPVKALVNSITVSRHVGR
ncbi:hypothetical protein [Amycolatopsis alba]|uniref:hypothetical protein n=1 Tax=Amycolatopsis alba TaxID=76020 RepID=UPI00037486D3|nr:hypothetical protein [Amycolatopsis alba]